jgi:hypothetical protein
LKKGKFWVLGFHSGQKKHKAPMIDLKWKTINLNIIKKALARVKIFKEFFDY